MILSLPLLLALAHADDPGIVGGSTSAPGAWPAVAALVTDGRVECGGVLIADDLVLTAAHCTARVDEVWLDTTGLAAPGIRVGVAGVEVPPDWRDTWDIGLVRLADPVEVAPARLALDCVVEAELFDGAIGTVLGWGATDEDGLTWPDALMEATVTVTDADCSTSGQGCNELVAPGGELVAGGDGIDACIGDSGGPLFLPIADGEPVVAGVVARGLPASDRTCGDGGIYTRPDAVVAWIEAAGGRELTRPDCGPVVPELGVSPLLAHVGEVVAAPIFVDDAVEVRLEGGVDFATVTLGHGAVRLDATEGEPGVGAVDIVAVGPGEAPRITRARVSVTVVPARQLEDVGTCGTSGGAGWLMLAGLVGLRRRRGDPR